MSFAPEPAFAHGSRARRPRSCSATSARPTSRRPRRCGATSPSSWPTRGWSRSRACVWLPILHGIILRTRPAKSARKYASIWTPEGSPLKVWTEKQALLLAGYLGQRGHPVLVRHAMRYGQPSIAGALDALRGDGAERVLVLPLYPQYAAATTASVGDAVAAWTTRRRNLPELRFVKHYHDDPGYIGALAAPGQRPLDDARPARPAGAELPRRAEALADARRPLPLRMPEDRRACSPSG